MEVLEIIVELWERCDKDREIRAIGVSLGEFKKTKVRQIALGEDYDMDKKLNLLNSRQRLEISLDTRLLKRLLIVRRKRVRMGRL